MGSATSVFNSDISLGTPRGTAAGILLETPVGISADTDTERQALIGALSSSLSANRIAALTGVPNYATTALLSSAAIPAFTRLCKELSTPPVSSPDRTHDRWADSWADCEGNGQGHS
jgi:hypothetical protein